MPWAAAPKRRRQSHEEKSFEVADTAAVTGIDLLSSLSFASDPIIVATLSIDAININMNAGYNPSVPRPSPFRPVSAYKFERSASGGVGGDELGGTINSESLSSVRTPVRSSFAEKLHHRLLADRSIKEFKMQKIVVSWIPT